MEAGDFDNTPAPSERPSLEELRDGVMDELLGGKGSGNEGNRPHRHNLLKGSTNRFNKGGTTELSVAPDQSPKSLDETPQKQKSDSGRDSRSSSSARRSSGATGTPSSVWIRSNMAVPPTIPLTDRVCVDPALHINESHAHAHHPGLLRGADFCNAGVPTAASSDLRPYPTLGVFELERILRQKRQGPAYRSLAEKCARRLSRLLYLVIRDTAMLSRSGLYRSTIRPMKVLCSRRLKEQTITHLATKSSLSPMRCLLRQTRVC